MKDKEESELSTLVEIIGRYLLNKERNPRDTTKTASGLDIFGIYSDCIKKLAEISENLGKNSLALEICELLAQVLNQGGK